MSWKVINFFDPEYADKVRAGLIDLNSVYWSPLNTVFMGNNDGFKIANTDLKMRGPGNMMGTKQSGLLELRFTNLAEDQDIVLKSRELAINTIKEDPNLESKENLIMKSHLKENIKQNINWSRIS